MNEVVESIPNAFIGDDILYFLQKLTTSCAIPDNYIFTNNQCVDPYTKIKKQIELLQDAVVIYRETRLPEFRVIITEQQMNEIKYNRAMKVIDAY